MNEIKTSLEVILEEIVRRAVREEIAKAINNAGHADKLLTPEEAAAVLGMSTKWLYRNAPKLPFTRKLGRKTLRFSQVGLQKYLTTRINSLDK